MELLADRDPEEARKLLDPVLEQMMEAVHHYESTVNQVMGDGKHEALDQGDGAYATQLSADARRPQGVEVQIRVGLNSGDVVVRSVAAV